jgi:hypothetical protein
MSTFLVRVSILSVRTDWGWSVSCMVFGVRRVVEGLYAQRVDGDLWRNRVDENL